MFRDGHVKGGSPLAAVPAAAAPQVLLADVSEFQPQINDPLYLAWSKAIVIRCLYGTDWQDHAWYGGDRRKQLHDGGIKFLGIYQYLRGGQDGGAQAQAFYDLVGPIQPGEVFIADFEEGAKPVLTAWYNKMLTLYGNAINPYLWTYSGLNFGFAAGVLPVQWIAAYQANEPVSPHVLWQFTSNYQVPGIGTCDCSVFHGTIDQLAALAYPAAQDGGGMFTIPGMPGQWLFGQYFADSDQASVVYWVGAGTTGRIYYSKSSDGGQTWATAKMP